MKVPFFQLTSTTQRVKEQYLQAVRTLLDQGNFILTEDVSQFEKAWAQKLKVKFCIGVSNGADALYLALCGAGIGPGDEVIVQGNAYNASVTAVLRIGAVPRFVDIDPDTLSLDTDLLEKAITKKTKAILPVHLYGRPADMKKIATIAQTHNLKIVEDCAQAHLAKCGDTYVGGFSAAAAFSFYPTKNLGAFGDAGAVVTNDLKIDEELRAIRNLGQTEKNIHSFFGTNMRLDPLQAIALSLKLQYLDAEITERQKIADYYDTLIERENLPVILQRSVEDTTPAPHLYVIQITTKPRDRVRAQLAERGVETAVHYPVPVYLQPFYTGSHDPCPITDTTCDRIISLPLFIGITREQQDYVIAALKQTLAS